AHRPLVVTAALGRFLRGGTSVTPSLGFPIGTRHRKGRVLTEDMNMRDRPRWLSAVIVAALIGPAAAMGCATHHNYNPYYYREYPEWDDHDRTYYLFWENETHREHREYLRRSEREQRVYWEWRRHHDRHHHRD